MKNLKQEKEELRKYYLHVLKQHNRSVFNKIGSYDCKILLAYIPLKTEVDVVPAIKDAMNHGIKVAVPTENEKLFAVLDNNWEAKLRTLENKTQSIKTDNLLDISTIQEKTLVLVPGLAFTESGIRLGRGSGFYDRVISLIENSSNYEIKGICTKNQIAESLPFDESDRKVSSLIICQ